MTARDFRVTQEFFQAIKSYIKDNFEKVKDQRFDGVKISITELVPYVHAASFDNLGLTENDIINITPIIHFILSTGTSEVDATTGLVLIDELIKNKETSGIPAKQVFEEIRQYETEILDKCKNQPKTEKERLLEFFENNPDFKQINLKFYDYIKNDKIYINQEFDIVKLLDKFKFLESLEEQEQKAKEGNIKLDELEDKEELFKILKSSKEYKPENPDIVSRIVVDKNILNKEKFNEAKNEINDIRASMNYITDQKKLQSIFDEFIIKYKEHPHLKMLLKDLIIYVMNHL